MSAARFLVGGRVQGVFFRASTREQALRLGLRGHARNLDDGDVEVIAAGDAQAPDRIEAGLRPGPPTAHVTRVERDAFDGDVAHGFEVR